MRLSRCNCPRGPKTFDPIIHETFLKKFEDYQFDRTATALIKSYLTDRTQKTILQITSSDRIGLYRGILQDTVLEPLLFNLYVSSMQIIADKTCKLVKHADDIF